jgi:hypothetical protein
LSFEQKETQNQEQTLYSVEKFLDELHVSKFHSYEDGKRVLTHVL